MKCPECATSLRRVAVSIEGARSKAISWQCPKCDYFEFEQKSGQQVLEELREQPLKMKQRIVGLSKDRLGIYINKHVVESLNLEKGEEVLISVPDKKHILIELSGN